MNISGSFRSIEGNTQPLKKVLSILLLVVFLFNVGGYYIVFSGLRFQTDKQLSSRLDANEYDQDETIELKIAVTLPYPVQSEDFQRVDGRFERDGQFYKLVKHKLQDDTLHIVCIRDHATRQLVDVMTDYVQLTQGLQGTDTNQKALHYLSKLVKDYYSQVSLTLLHQMGNNISMQFFVKPDLIPQLVIPVQSPPPRS